MSCVEYASDTLVHCKCFTKNDCSLLLLLCT